MSEKSSDLASELRSYRLLPGEEKIRPGLESLLRHLEQAQFDANRLITARFRREERDFDLEHEAIESLKRDAKNLLADVKELDYQTRAVAAE